MPHSHRLVIAASLALMFSTAAHAADPAPKPDNKAAADKPASDKPAAGAVKELPSRPFPKVLPPSNSVPKAEMEGAANKGDATPAKPLADKPDVAENKLANKLVDPLAAAEPKPRRKPKPKVAAVIPVDPALNQVLQDTVHADAHGQAGDRAPYIVQSRDTLDRVIKKTLPTSPFSPQILREAFMKANPQVFQGGRVLRLRAGQSLRIPNAAVFRLVVLGELSPPASGNTAAVKGGNLPGGEPAAAAQLLAMNPTALPDSPKNAGPLAVPAAIPAPPVLSIPRQAVDVATAAGPSPSVSPEEKKKWVRFP